MADTESRKLLTGVWASGSTADREDPVDVGITRTAGFDLRYEQIGSGAEPERTVVNQKFREWSGWGVDNIRRGGVKPWDALVDYYQHARVAVNMSKYRATVATGPATGNATDPTTTGQTVWELY